jgi:hypothetical protein
LHLALTSAVGAREIIWVISHGLTILSESQSPFWEKNDRIASTLIGETLPVSHPVRQVLAGYEHLAGIEAGYGYFSPHVTDSCRLVFEIHYSDGRIEFDLPSVGSHAAGLRFASLLDRIRLTTDAGLRELMIKMLTYAHWQEHPEATKIRAIFGDTVLPSVDSFERGERERFEVRETYEFVKQERPEAKPSE